MPRVTGLFECLLEKAILGQTPRGTGKSGAVGWVELDLGGLAAPLVLGRDRNIRMSAAVFCIMVSFALPCQIPSEQRTVTTRGGRVWYTGLVRRSDRASPA